MSCLRIGHRGAAGYAPGNTIASIEKELEIGVDGVEIDVRCTSDGHLVLLHDRYLQRSTNGVGDVADLTLDDIRAFRTKAGDQPIPTLAEVLDKISGRAGLIIELKTSGIAGRAMAAVEDAGFRGPLWVASFLHAELLQIRAHDSSPPTIALLDGIPVIQTAFMYHAQATHAGVAIDSLDRALVRRLHDSSFRVFTYTADEPEDIAYAKACNVDGIISNFPDRV
jgi:glycerophosphoryl diester phosphodiesterase